MLQEAEVLLTIKLIVKQRVTYKMAALKFKMLSSLTACILSRSSTHLELTTI